MKRIVIFALVVLTLASCGRVKNTFGLGGAGAKGPRNVEVNDKRFRTSISSGKEDRRAFIVTVTPVAIDPPAAREAGRYKATVYCLNTYGGSDTDWQTDPGLPIQDLPVEGDVLTLLGRCTQK